MERPDVEQWKGREVARLLALMETERRYYQEIIASIPVGLAVVDKSAAIKSANRAFRQAFGLRNEDLPKRTLDQVIPSAPLMAAVAQVAAQEGAPAPVVIAETGKPFRVSLAPIRDWSEDTALEVLLIVEDLGGVSTGPAIPDETPAMIWTGDSTIQQFAIVAGEQTGVVHPGANSIRIHAADRQRLLDFYRSALATPGRHACEYRATSALDEPVWYRDVFVVTPGEPGQPMKVTGVVTDITARKQSEQMVEQGHRLEAIGSLSRTLTHELNNTLMVVTGYGEELLAGLSHADPRRAEVQEILNAAGRISALSGQLLPFTRRQAYPAEPVTVADIVGRVITPESATSSVPAHLRIMADPGQFEEIIRSFLFRLREFGRPAIAARAVPNREQTAEGLPPGEYVEVVLAVPGMPVISLDSLLAGKDPTGPDVARSHALIREWGGGIWQAQGEVHLVFPAAAPLPPAEQHEPAVEALPVAEVPAPAPVPEPEEEMPETVLVVEDESGIRALIRKILRRQNYEVLEAGSPDEAMEVARTHPGRIDLLVTDLTLPQRGGRQLADEMNAVLPHLKVLYISGYTDDTAVYEGEVPAGAALLQKPFTLGSLLAKVREVLDQKD